MAVLSAERDKRRFDYRAARYIDLAWGWEETLRADDLRLASEFVGEVADIAMGPGGEEALSRFLEERRDRLTPQLADQLGKLAKQALLAGEWPLVGIAAGMATSVNLDLGRTAESIEARLLAVQAAYQQAGAPAQYDAARTAFLDIAQLARDAGQAHLELVARGFALQCGYFGAEVVSEPDAEQAWIRRAVRDLIDLLESRSTPMAAEETTSIMEFAFAALDRATAVVYTDQDSMTAALLEVAAAIHARLPPHARLSDDPHRAAGIAEVLARLPEPRRT